MQLRAFVFPVCLLFFATNVGAQVTIPQNSLLIDLDADLGVKVADGNKVENWTNQAPVRGLERFEKQDSGRKVPGSGRPQLKKGLAEINGHHAVAFVKQELCNRDEDATDSLILGCGFTWIVILKPYRQTGELKEVNTFFGNLKNGGNFEGVWGNLADDNRVWTDGRNGITFGRWDSNNPFIATTQKLDSNRFYLLRRENGQWNRYRTHRDLHQQPVPSCRHWLISCEPTGKFFQDRHWRRKGCDQPSGCGSIQRGDRQVPAV